MQAVYGRPAYGRTTYEFNEQLNKSKARRSQRDIAALWALFPYAEKITCATPSEDRFQGVDYWVYWDAKHRDGWDAKQLGANGSDRRRWINPFDPELHIELGLYYPNHVHPKRVVKLGWTVADPKPNVRGYLFSWESSDWSWVYAFDAHALQAAIRSGAKHWLAHPEQFKLKERYIPSVRGSVRWETRCSFPRLSWILQAMAMQPQKARGSLFFMAYLPEGKHIAA